MLDVKRGEITLDLLHHHGNGLVAHDRQPFTFGHGPELVAVLAHKRLSHWFQIVAGIKSVGNRTDVLAKRLAIAQVCRAREHVDLGAGIVDVIFACHLVAGEGQEARQRIAKYRAAAMADMHRAGRIGGHVFDIDLFAGGARASAVGRALAQQREQLVRPGFWL